MKKTKFLTRLGAVVFALAILFAMSVPAWAATTLDSNGEQGAFANPDTPTVIADKTLVLEKEIRAYNLNEATVKAPTISYTYSIAGDSENKSITDAADKHTMNASVTAPTKEGIAAGVTITGTDTNVIAFTTEDTLYASTNGTKNVKDLTINFGNVVFTGAGVYRYKITEALTTGYTYDNTGVTDTTGNHIRYVDVYVKPSDTFSNGSTPAEWDIYGFTCFYNDADITDANKTTVAVKTTGFVDGTTNGSTAILADQYYTYNLTISKNVVNDNYAKITHQFPFTVIFTNNDITHNNLLRTTVSGTVTDFTHDAGTPTWSGVPTLLSGGSIKYIGIPMGTDVEVYETNDVDGATYAVTTTRTNATTETATDQAVISTTIVPTAIAQAAPKPEYQSTKTVIDTTKNADDDNEHSVAITNTLLRISPTGLAFRVAPYVLMLAAGVSLIVLFIKRKENEATDMI